MCILFQGQGRNVYYLMGLNAHSNVSNSEEKSCGIFIFILGFKFCIQIAFTRVNVFAIFTVCFMVHIPSMHVLKRVILTDTRAF